jgi:hypothetical protein
LSPPPDQTDCTSLPPGPCWYIGWGWYICYVGC